MADDIISRFNPRARAGRDDDNRRRGYLDRVSIHAPARGATRCDSIPANPGIGFNPRARAGRDTRTQGVPVWIYRFNPRARAGRDLCGIT